MYTLSLTLTYLQAQYKYVSRAIRTLYLAFVRILLPFGYGPRIKLNFFERIAGRELFDALRRIFCDVNSEKE